MSTRDKYGMQLVPLFFAVLGCGNAPEEPASQSTSQQEEATEATVPGYAHSLGKSGFETGPGAATRTEFGFSKTVGDFGVFGTFLNTGWSAGVPNGDAPSTKLPPLFRSGDEHNKRVLGYFVTAGLPADQVSHVNAHATVSHGGPVSELHNPTVAPSLDWYSSVLSRKVQGVPVPDSFAFARFDIQGKVVSESVYWPPIPAAVLSEALAFQNQLAQAATNAAFRSKLPQELASQPGTIQIRHSGMMNVGSFWARATFDVLTTGKMTRVRHFDANGIEVVPPDLPQSAAETGKQ